MKDNFSGHASMYARYRPAYPPELFDFILGFVAKKERAWDCATGNGQTAKELARYFTIVCATDISRKQLDNAQPASNIHYTLQPAEKTDFADNSFDLITVSQALHWFQFDVFYKEVTRVAKPGAPVAAWMYALLNISPEIDKLIQHHHDITLGAHWDKERKYVDDNYTRIPFPFKEISAPVFQMNHKWTLPELEGYLNTWSALQKFIADKGHNPVEELVEKIKPYWKEEKRSIRFPLYLRMGKIDK